ncbi:MAG: hypothetical protein PGN34_05265 [Methylobacterium frigidaeris]
MNRPHHRSGAELVPFPGPEARRPRRIPGEGEPRGTILLYTGVRYERLPDAAAVEERAHRVGDRRRQG